MKRNIFFRFFLALLFCGTFFLPKLIFCQSAIGQLETISGQKINQTSVPSVSAPEISGMIMQGLINSMFTPSSTSAADQAKIEAAKLEQAKIAAALAEKQKQEAAKAQAKHDELMTKIKTLSGETLQPDFKTLNGDAEQLRSAASEQFEPTSTDAVNTTNTNATNFFGIALSETEINTLMNSENDPMIVDLSEAEASIVSNLKTEEELNTAKEGDNSEVTKDKNSPECIALKTKLDGFKKNRTEFEKTINLTKTELAAWEKQNNDAFWNAVTDGVGFASGQFIDYIKETRSSAGLILKNLELKENDLIKNKTFTTAEITKYKSILNARMLSFDLSKLASDFKEAPDYYDFVANSMRATLLELSKTNTEYAAMYEDPRFIECFSKFPKVEMASFLSSKALEAFLVDPLVKKSVIKKLPYVSIAQLAVNEIYNATDMLTSYLTICTLNEADGKAAEAAKYIQQKIDDMQSQYNDCK